jgi:hypothetical protein
VLARGSAQEKEASHDENIATWRRKSGFGPRPDLDCKAILECQQPNSRTNSEVTRRMDCDSVLASLSKRSLRHAHRPSPVCHRPCGYPKLRASSVAFHDRREIIPRHLRRDGQTLTIAPFDRREIFTELEAYCRCYHSPEAISRHRSRLRLPAAHGARHESDL